MEGGGGVVPFLSSYDAMVPPKTLRTVKGSCLGNARSLSATT